MVDPTAQSTFASLVGGSTPQSKALNGYKAPTLSSPLGSATTSFSFAPPAPPAAPTTPVTKHTVSTPDGTTVTQHYAASPQPGLISNRSASPAATTAPGTGSYVNGSGAYVNNVQNLTNQATTPNPSVTAAQQGVQTIANNQGANAPTINQATSGLLGIAGNQTPAVTDAASRLSTLQKNDPLLLASLDNNPNAIQGIVSGRSQIAANALGAEEGAASNNYQQALAGEGQQITAGNEAGQLGATAQGQQVTAGADAGQLGQGQQNAQITAATNAASAAHPEQVPYGTQYGSPADIAAANANGTSGGGALNPLNNVSSIAQQVISGQISPSQAYSMGGNITNWQGVLNQAIQQAKPGFNTATAEGSYAAKQSNTTTAGTAATTAASDLYKSTYPQVQQLNTTTNNIDQFGNVLLGTMVAPDGTTINPTDSKYGNQTISVIRGQLSSAQQAQFDTTFAQLKAQIASLLSSGGSQIPTQITEDANKIIDGSAPLSTLTATLARIKTEGGILAQNLQGQLNSAGGSLGISPTGTSGKTSTGLSYTITP